MSEAPPENLTPQPPSKVSPETLVLRGKPRPAVRFRRGLIIGGVGTLVALLVSLAWLALEPASSRKASLEIQDEDAARKGTDDALAGLPTSYGDVPRLGPPLPGDLGRPILEHQRGLARTSGGPEASVAGADPARAAADAERQRLILERQAARSSPLLVELKRTNGGVSNPPPIDPPQSAQMDEGSASIQTPSAAASADQQRKIDFARLSEGEVDPHRLRPAPSRWILSAGTIIPASLITGLNSDLPGIILAQVTENVRDSVTGEAILVPQGARLVGNYDSMVAYGQRRALIVWKRIVFPDGSSIGLDNMPASDSGGHSGIEDRVDSHSWQLIKGMALSTLFGVGTELSLGSGESDLLQAIRESAQQNAAHAGDQITAQNLKVQPTITVRPGWPVRALVNKDLILRPWRE